MMRVLCMIGSTGPYERSLRDVLTLLSDQQKLHILQQKYSDWTPLECAAYWGHTEIIHTLLVSLQSSADRLKLLMVYRFYTPLHVAAICGHTESVKMILDCLTADQQIQIMSVQSDWKGETAIQLADRRGRTDTVRVLREYQHRADNLMRGYRIMQAGQFNSFFQKCSVYRVF